MIAFRLLLLFALFLPAAPASAFTTSAHALKVDYGNHNVVIGANEAALQSGESYHTVILLWGRLEVFGQLDHLLVLSGHVVFHEGARLNGKAEIMGGSFESLPGAEVKPENVLTHTPGPFWRLLLSGGSLWRDNVDWVYRLYSGLASCLVFWLLGLALFGVFPKLQELTAASLLQDWLKNLGAALTGLFASPALGALLVVSLVGILLVPLYLLLLGLLGLVAYLVGALWAGQRLLPPKPGKRLRPAGFFLGLLALQFLWVVPVHGSWLPVLFLWSLGWGSVLRSLRRIWAK